MARIKDRVPEGGAIDDNDTMSTEEYSDIMERVLGSHYRSFVSDLLEACALPHGARALEIGPGPGWVGIELAKRRSDIVLLGVDASSDMIRVAVANAEKHGVADRVSYSVGEAESLSGVEDESVDMVFSRDSLHHWTDPTRSFKSILRVLRPTGVIYIGDGRRNIGLAARVMVNVAGPLIAGKMARFWKSSIAAGYTGEEVSRMVSGVGADWTVRESFMDLRITSHALH